MRVSDGTPSVGSALSTFVDQYGPALFGDAPRLKLLLSQTCPDDHVEIGAVVAALDVDVPQRLLAAHDDVALGVLLPVLVDRVAAMPGIPRAAATAAVRSWALALALPADALERGMPAAARPVATPAFDVAAIVTPLAGRSMPVVEKRRPLTPRAPPPVDVAPEIPALQVPAPRVTEPRVMSPSPEPRPVVEPTARTPVAAAAAAPFVMQEAMRRTPARAPWGRIATAAVIIAVLGGTYWWHAQTPDAFAPSNQVAAGVGGKLETRPAPAPPDIAAAHPEPEAVAVAPPARAAPPAPVATSPVPAGPRSASPSIARIDVPALAAGKPFEVRLFVTGTPTDVAAVEERFVDPATGRSASRVIPASALAHGGASNGSLAIPVRPLATEARLVMDLTLVDRSGVRSAPRRVTFDTTVARPAPRPTNPCTMATCGSVVAVHDGEGGGLEVVVRMDDRSIETVRQNVRPAIGARVRKVGERYVPAGDE